jgi:hypothetical protein
LHGDEMSSSSIHAEPESERSLTAWGLSVLFHLSAVVLLAIAVQQWPRGAAENGTGSIGLVLNHADDAGAVREGDEGERDTPRAADSDLEPPALIATRPPTLADVVPEPARVLPVRLAAAPVAQKAQPGDENASAQPAAGGIGRSGSSGGTGYATVNVFGVEGKGSKFVYLFDRSASMEGPPLSAAKKQLLESLRSLESVHQFQIIFFNSHTRVFDASGGRKRIAFASDRNKQLAANFVGGITADGGTDRMIALREAIAMSPNVIFFLTDADDPMSANELGEIARINRRAGAAICVIEFGRKPAPMKDNFLMQIARESGGQYGYVDTTTLSRPVQQRK